VAREENRVSVDELVLHVLTHPDTVEFDRLALFALNLSRAGARHGSNSGWPAQLFGPEFVRFCPHIAHPSHQEVRRPHPELEGSEDVLDRTASNRHHIWIPVQPVLGSLQNGFMLPAFNAALLARGALVFQGTG
jgi:hypothetical protein